MKDLSFVLGRLSYDPSTGAFTRPDGTAPRLHMVNSGYAQISVGKSRRFYAHRLAWFLFYGENPAGLVDHINGNKLDNRIQNLRLATKSQNNIRRKPRADNSSGYRGVSKFKSRWRAKANWQGRSIHLGYFDSPELASEAFERWAAQTHHPFIPASRS